MLAAIDLVPGTRCRYQGQVVCLRQLLDLQTVLAEYEATGVLASLPVHELQAETAPAAAHDSFLSVPTAAYANAQRKLAALQPLLQGVATAARVAEVAHAQGVHSATIRRWLRAYRLGGSLLALVEKERPGGRGGSRLAPEVEVLLQEVITKHFLTTQGKAPAHVYEELTRRCHLAGVPPPTDKTLRRRLQRLAPEEQVRRRLGARAATERFAATQANTRLAPHPLAVVQLDHALLNIVLVHEDSRQPMSRPWLTLATDVCSRMVVGLYLAFEEPGAGGTGLCLAQAVLPKEVWLSRRQVVGEWPCWGVMQTLHLDNAKEFHGKMLRRAAERYGIELAYRPPARPHYGGHVERLIRTIKFHVRRLAGSLVVRPRGRRRQVMPQRATFSLPEFERWLATYIVNVYHHRLHQSLGMSPYERYQQGILGSPGQPGTGPPARLQDALQVQLDFMPLVERSIQRYGVLIDCLTYYAEVLRPFIDSRAGSTTGSARQQFVFKRDPRDLSCVYFLHPATQQYHRVPLANMSRPAISLWEQREIVRRELALNPDRKRLTEEVIFNGLARLVTIEQEAARRTNKMTKAARRLLDIIPKGTQVVASAVALPADIVPSPPEVTSQEASDPIILPVLPVAFIAVEPFDDLDDGTSHLRYGQLAERAPSGAHPGDKQREVGGPHAGEAHFGADS